MAENSHIQSNNIFEIKRREIYWQLKELGLEEHECQAEALLIIEQVTGLKQAEQIISDVQSFSERWQEETARIVNSRRQRKPLAYCLGEISFGGLQYRIIPGVLIPRVDTETLVEAAVEWAQDKGSLKIAEIGVGSGIIAISLLKRLPECTVWACDINEAAITLSLGNARRHGVDERLTLVHGDWKKILPPDFDLIVSNPPYISTSMGVHELQAELRFEPKEALFAGVDGLDFYRQFAALLPNHFAKAKQAQLGKEQNLYAAFEIGDLQDQMVKNIFEQLQWSNLLIKDDLNGLPRVFCGRPPNKKLN